MNFQYTFKWGSEIFWAVVVAIAVAIVPILVGADADAILADPKTWLVALAAAAARAAVAGAILAVQGLLRQFIASRS